jgi:hypothetical protein
VATSLAVEQLTALGGDGSVEEKEQGGALDLIAFQLFVLGSPVLNDMT